MLHSRYISLATCCVHHHTVDRQILRVVLPMFYCLPRIHNHMTSPNYCVYLLSHIYIERGRRLMCFVSIPYEVRKTCKVPISKGSCCHSKQNRQRRRESTRPLYLCYASLPPLESPPAESAASGVAGAGNCSIRLRT
jgi:hypothetical protein